MNVLKISNTGNICAVGSDDGELHLYHIPSFELIGKAIGHSAKIMDLKWSPDDKQIISVSYDNSICVWNNYLI